jgi:hypothetical protein
MPWDAQGPELLGAPEQFAAFRAHQGEASAGGAQRLEEAASCEPGAHRGTLHQPRALFGKWFGRLESVSWGYVDFSERRKAEVHRKPLSTLLDEQRRMSTGGVETKGSLMGKT